jgi:hypothetical protein
MAAKAARIGPAVTVEVTGAAQLRLALLRMNDDLSPLTAIHAKAAKPVYSRARTLVPVVSGRLKGSIELTAGPAGASIRAGRGLEPYAGPIHFGWPRHNIEAQPFLYRALKDHRQDVIQTYKDEIRGLVKRLDRETPG